MESFFKKSNIGSFESFTFNHYECYNIDIDFYNDSETDNKVLSVFKDMYKRFLEQGGTHVPGKFQIDGAILLENEEEIIAGIFYDLQKSLSNIYILLAFTEKDYRRKGIYKMLHNFIDQIGSEHGRIGVNSFMGLEDTLMIETIAGSVGYKPLFQVVHRPIKK